MFEKSFRVVRTWAILMVLALTLAGCGSGGGGGGSVGTVPTVDSPSIPTVTVPTTTGTTTTTPTPVAATTPTPGPDNFTTGTQAAFNPAQPPSLPSAPPPTLSKSAKAVSADANAPRATIFLAQGWNIVSFPFAQLSSASGFTHKLYAYGLGTFNAVDPVNSPTAIDTRIAYLAYADGNTSVTVTGTVNTGQVASVPLVQGWNLVGCPNTDDLPWANMSASRVGLTRVLDEVATASQSPDASWLSRYAYGLVAGISTGEDILAGGSLLSTQGRWLFVWQDTDLNLGVAPPQPKPVITTLSASSLSAGTSLTITGSGFGALETGFITLGGVLVPGPNITSWTSTQIVLTVPDGVASGHVVVFVNLFPSNRVSATAGNTGGAGTAALSGHVQDTSGNALTGAQIVIDSGQYATSDSGGDFLADNIPAGEHLVIVTHIGNNTGSGIFTFTAGVTKTVLVTLAPVGGGGSGGSGGSGGGQTGSFTTTVYPFNSGGSRWFVYQIVIYPYGDYSRRQSQTWFSDLGSSSQYLTYSNANIGKQYAVYIQWAKSTDTSQRQSATFYHTVTRSGEQFYHYSPSSKQ